MMLDNPLLFGLHLLCLIASTSSLRIPLRQSHVKRALGATTISRTKLGSSGSSNLAVVNDENDSGDVGLATKNDLLYMANVSIGGNEYTLQLDTGSSDLWLATTDNIPDSQTSDITFNLTYGIGYAAGHIAQAPVKFANADVKSQAFLLATDANNPVSQYGAAGIIGLGFTALSSIDSAVNKSGASWGRSFLYNVFQAEPSTPNFITFALQRADDPEDDVTGSFTIGEYADGLDAVAKMPNISTWPVINPNRWNVLLEGFYIGGVSQPLKSNVLGVPSGKTVALIDSGTSYTYADPDIVNSMYSSIKGASLDSASGQWNVPCDAEVDITLVFGGFPYAVHPLDVVDKSLSDANKCSGTFIGQSVAVGKGEFDWLVGDNVLRSIYTLYDLGDFQPDGKMGNPYVKMLSTTNLTAASADFHKIRGGNANLTVTATGVDFNGTASASGGTDPTGLSTTDQLADNVNKLLNYVPALLGILGFNSLVLLSLAICAMIYLTKRRKGKGKGAVNDDSSREAYHYQRVRSQYDPQDMPPPSPSAPAMPMNDVQSHSRPASSTSKKPGRDSPFTPPVEIKYEDVNGDMADQGLRPGEGHVDNNPGIQTSHSSHLDLPNEDLPVPRPRFVSTTTMGSDMYGRPQSLFSVSSGPLLSNFPNQQDNRPASAYEMPMGAMASPRQRLISNPLSDGRPESSFSTSPLLKSDNSPGPSPNSPMSGHHVVHPGDMSGENMMSPPRPRFMGEANMGPRPDSSFSMGGAQPLRPQSQFIDASGERPFSTAM